MRTENHEVIFAIVNSGVAEEAMNVAREQGVRGGNQQYPPLNTQLSTLQ